MTREATSDALARSRQLAGFVGPLAAVMGLSEAKNLRIWETGDAPLTYMAGLIWFLLGLGIVRLHNRWTAGWPVAVTIMGWFFLVFGLFRMFFPDAQQGNQNTPALAAYALYAVLIAVGSLLTFKARRPRG